jgi:hypothetical protein
MNDAAAKDLCLALMRASNAQTGRRQSGQR